MQKVSNIYRLYLICSVIIAGISFLSCEDTVVLDLPNGNDKLVVNGWITNENKVHKITLHKTVRFNSINDFPPVSGAEIYITDRLSFRYDFLEIGSSGVYASDSLLLIGKQGEAYTLHIKLENGSEYISKREVLNQLPELSDLSTDFFFDPGVSIDDNEARKYYLIGQVNDIPNINNYYRWKINVNGIDRNGPDDIFLFDDKFSDGLLFEIEAINVTMQIGDIVELQHMSMTESAYKYYEQLSEQLSSGIIPNTPPAIIFGNIENINDSTEVVLGYFGASAISNSNLIISL